MDWMNKRLDSYLRVLGDSRAPSSRLKVTTFEMEALNLYIPRHV